MHNMNRVNNRVVDGLTFFQWLNSFEFITKREYRELPEYKQNNYRAEYEAWKKGISQYN